MVKLALRPDNPMNKAMMLILLFEVIVFGLGFPGMIMVSDRPLAPAVAATVVACLLCLVGAARIKTPFGYLVGWLAQVAGIALGVLTPWMYAMGLIFFMIWAVSFVLGRRIEATL